MKGKGFRFLKRFFAILIGLIAILFLTNWLLPKGPQDLMVFDDPWGQEREMITAAHHGVVAGTPWASQAALEVLEQGGNAYDAAIAGLCMLYVTHGEASGFPGIAPTMLYHAAQDTVKGYIGVGTAPEKATISRFKERGFETVPKMDIYAQLIPAGPDAIIAILKEYGTLSFSELVQPAIDKALEGFPVHHVMHYNLDLSLSERLGYTYLLPYNSQVYLNKKPWKPLHPKERFRRPDLAKTFTFLANAEQQALAAGKSREEALLAVRDAFYNGAIADAIAEYHQEHEGLISKKDLTNYAGAWEKPYLGKFGDFEILLHGPWSQGMTLAMALDILSKVDLINMKQNSGLYIHTLVQALELAMSDREAYFGDPHFTRVPSKQLLAPTYGEQRHLEISDKAFKTFPPPSNIAGFPPFIGQYPKAGSTDPKTVGDDTSQIIVADSSGNVIAITPSDFPMTPMLPDWDLTLGNRMNQFRLEEDHPAALQPGKRPRVTPQAVMIRKAGRFYMAINTPGGDNQIQAMLQVLLNHIVFGDDIQTAIERPRFKTSGFPNSFAPHGIKSASLEVEENMDESSIETLKDLGYAIKIKEKWHIAAGVGAIINLNGQYQLGADPRAETVALGK